LSKKAIENATALIQLLEFTREITEKLLSGDFFAANDRQLN
jgi:hypothetical protein